MTKKNIKIDLNWLFTLGVVTLLTIGLVSGFDDWESKAFDIQFHDNYLILSIGQVFLLLYLNVTFWIYLIRQGINRFKRQSGNVILLILSGLLIFITSQTFKFSGSIDDGWTIYPPMSASPTNIPEKYIIPSAINSFIQAYELFQIGVLGLIGIMIGKRAE